MNFADLTNPTLPLPGTPTKWGYRITTDEDYFTFPAVNASLLKAPTLAEMYAKLTQPKRQSEALALGNLTDMAILTPSQPWGERFVVADLPINPTTSKPYGPESAKGKAAWDAAKAANPGKHVATLEEIRELKAELDGIAGAFRDSALCVAALDGALTQVSGFLFHPAWQCWIKWRPDVLPQRPDDRAGWWLADLKTSRRHVLQFERDWQEYDYATQAAWYCHCHEQLLASQGMRITVSNFDFLVVSKADADARNPRPAMARRIRVPMNPDVNTMLEAVNRRLWPVDGLGRVETFLAAAAMHASSNPDPADRRAISAIWGSYEHENEPFTMARLPRGA